MDNWELVNKLRFNIFYEKEVENIEDDLKYLSLLAMKSYDPAFIKTVLHIKEQYKNGSISEKLLWMTSTVGSQFYPPLNVGIAGPLCWTSRLVCELDNFELSKRYTHRKILKVNIESKIQQCSDIEDCSLVSSLINISIRDPSLLRVEESSPNKFNLNMFFNGTFDRLVTVDISKIPTTSNGKQLSLLSDNISIKILEIAYLLTFSGSYETNGSNTAIDTFRLTGYYPEISSLQRYSFNKLYQLLKSELCLLALGTGTDLGHNEFDLISNHDYPVIDINMNSKLFEIRDPLNASLTIKLDFESICKSFKQLYLNWRIAKLFKNEKSITFIYKNAISNKYNTVLDKPLFLLRNETKNEETIWLLLETHLTIDIQGNMSIAYLDELPGNILNYVIEKPHGACNIGLQLLKLKISPEESKQLYCHSLNDNSFTVHMVSISSHILIQKFTMHHVLKELEFNFIHNMNGKGMRNFEYFKYPTFQLKIVSNVQKQVLVDIQLLSEDSHDLISFQLFDYNDYELTKPILNQNQQEHQRYTIEDIPLFTNQTYKIICSVYEKLFSTSFKLHVLWKDLGSESGHKIDLKQIYTEYGELPFQSTINSCWPINSNRKKIVLSTKLKTKCFIRVVPKTATSAYLFRCNIFESESHQILYKEEDFKFSSLGGIVVKDLQVHENTELILLLERERTISLSDDGDNILSLDILVGSTRKITLDEYANSLTSN